MKKLIIIFLGVISVSCNTQKENHSVSINDLANRYYEETISMYPQYSYFYDIPIEELGSSFSMKEFHSKVLENGSIPLYALSSVINDWIENKRTTTKS